MYRRKAVQPTPPSELDRPPEDRQSVSQPVVPSVQRDSELVLTVSAVEETPAEPFVSIPSQIDSVVEETPAEPIIVPTQVASGQSPLPPLRVLPEIFFRDGP